MRRGYWRIQLRELRRKLAAGANIFSDRTAQFVIDRVCADDDIALDGELPLVEDVNGHRLVVDADTTSVAVVHAETGERMQLQVELAAFVEALHFPPSSSDLDFVPVAGDCARGRR
jgi:hypothetical protein